MISRPLKRSDLPKRRNSWQSLHIPVLYDHQKRYISDIHMADEALCWLEGANGKPTKIEEIELLLDTRTVKEMTFLIKIKRNNIEEHRKVIRKLATEIRHLQKDVMDQSFNIAKS